MHVCACMIEDEELLRSGAKMLSVAFYTRGIVECLKCNVRAMAQFTMDYYYP